jgi:hypothetical protein
MSQGVTDRLVLDGSLTLARYFADEANPYADAVAQELASREAVVPSLWRLEIVNTLVVGERRKWSTEAQAASFIARLGLLPIVTIPSEYRNSFRTSGFGVLISEFDFGRVQTDWLQLSRGRKPLK